MNNNTSCKIEPSNQKLECIEKKLKEESSQESSSIKIIENGKSDNSNNNYEFLQAMEFQTNLQPYNQNDILGCELGVKITEIPCLENNQKLFGEKKFICTFPNCNAQFSQSSNLKRHFRIHTNEKPYTCKVCQRAFNTSSNLKQHLQIHLTKNDRMKFVCQICNKQYYYASNLKKHVQIYHQELGKEQNSSVKLLENQLKAIEQNNLLLQSKNQSPLDSQSQIFVKHNDHIDLLINGFLYFYDGKTVYIHQLESTEINKYDEWGCNPICELSHYSSLRELGNIYKAIEKTLNNKITYNQLMNQNNCNSFICTCKLMQEHPNGENCLNNLIKCSSIQQQNNQKGLCLCNETKQFTHKHSENCGHIPIMHAGHIDYIVNGQLHFLHQDHCDNHGKIEIFSEQDLINQQNQNLIHFQQLYQLPQAMPQQQNGANICN